MRGAVPDPDNHTAPENSAKALLEYMLRGAERTCWMQANVWTEYISDEATVEYMLLPRLAALAETVWSPPQLRDWGSFLRRLKEQLPHLEARNLTYRPLGM